MEQMDERDGTGRRRPPLARPPAHPCRLAPVVREVGRYLAGADAPIEAQQAAACRALRNARDDFEGFAASVLDATALVSVELAITRAGRDRDRDAVSVHAHLPSPLSLLLVCARNCDDGDLVALTQHTARCGNVRSEAHWPFGLAEAEVLTRPVTASFAELREGPADSVRRHERSVPLVGRIVTETETGLPRVLLPRVQRWSAGASDRPGWSWRTGTRRRGYARIRSA